MTKREALSVLIRHAAQDCQGVGCGIRSLPSREEKEKVKQAIMKVWKDAYNFPFSEHVLQNMGLY